MRLTDWPASLAYILAGAVGIGLGVVVLLVFL